MKITLIIPDLHLRWEQAEKIIKHVGSDEIIFLGDYFDDFGDDAQSVGETADWLEHSVTLPNRIHLFGNHDVHYAFPQPHFQCSGYEQWKHFMIRDRYPTNKVWDKLKWYHVLDGKFLLTHAGLHKFYLPDQIKALRTDRPAFLKAITEYLDEEIIKDHRNKGWALHAGHSRGGMQRVGGITWCDFEREFYPIQGLNQILGHTPQRFGVANWCYWDGENQVQYNPSNNWKIKSESFDDVGKSYNLNLDVSGNTHWAVWNGKTFKFGNYRDM